jgi:hypothetical protein
MKSSSVLLWLATLAALLSLPRAWMPPAWILGVGLPALLFAWLLDRRWLGRGGAILVGLLFLASGVGLAVRWGGTPIGSAFFMVWSIPPLLFLTTRREGGRATIALGLGFALLIGGLVFAGRGLGPWHVMWIGAATASLGLQATQSARARDRSRGAAIETGSRPGGQAKSRVRSMRSAALLSISLSVIVLSLGSYRTLWLIPELIRTSGTPIEEDAPEQDPNAERQSKSGERGDLGESFELDRLSPGSELVLRSAELIQVRSVLGEPLSETLYFRISGFERPGLRSWRPGRIRPRPLAPDGEHRAAHAPENTHLARLEIERLEAQRGVLYVPPGVTQLSAPGRILHDPERGFFVQAEADSGLEYEVEYQDLAPFVDLTTQLRTDPRLTQLPSELDTPLFRELAQEALARARSKDPERLLRAVALVLLERCRYERREPAGPFDTALLNFLDGERHGYCMHFASAAAILLRKLGVPARIAVGLYGGDPDADDPAHRYFGSQHAHAWVELPTRELGWIVFDPTPPEHRATGDLPGLDDVLGLEPELAESQSTAAMLAESLLWIALALLLPLLLLLGRPRRRRAALRPTPTRVLPARKLLEELLGLLAARGYPRSRRQTLESFLSMLAERSALQDSRIERAVACYQALRFGSEEWSARHEQTLRAGIAAARELPQAAQMVTTTGHLGG